ncbi:protein mono-ADP-ribosyltransferase PARP6-like isoform X1 [Periophthalmus magnuspinnatus]|uniref:protein mono-ADP-ribosyltransferase PARP6-like isoform X1 n=1 Tax=Periophthalmus magnuspinnatus TaxID=409849 RepID=UPI002436B70D|nr:protein mono-ADP-ribosyltransferase PARP6-like isoform X1 [Periophthalmus magnuspinnatus]XP_055078275.1 protein mono-ADP-ribosyltransferase PARP6-like isoform X1 [Periophthalmus magnuspinnatus]
MMKTLKVSMETGRKQRAGYHISNNRHSAIHLCQNEIRATDLLRHPQLQADIEAFKTHYSKSAVSVREYMTIDEVDIDLIIKSDFLNALVTKAWKINSSEPIIIRLHFSLSQYLDGPAPTVEVLQSSNRHTFCIGKQLQNILTAFINNEWRNLTNEKVICHQKRRNSWFRPAGTIKKFRARFNIWLPSSKSNEPLESNGRSRIILPTVNLNRFSNTTASYAIKNPTGELFAYTPSGKRVAVSAVKSSTELSTKQLIELLFSTQAIRHCKAAPTLQHGFLVQIMKYAEQRLLTLNEYCVICDERHVFQNGPLLKPAVCTRELCVFSFYTLGVMSEVTEEVATGAEVIDLLVAMCRAALQSKRKSIIFEPYPSIVDPCNPKTLAFTHKRKSYDRLQAALDSVLLVRQLSQGPYCDLKKQMDEIDPLAHPLLQWILASNRSHIIKLPQNRQLKFMHTPHQFLLICSPPYKEVRFQMARKLYGSTFAFHGSHIENWHSILRNGLVNASFTKLQLHGAAYGKGIYLSPNSGMSFGYSEMGYGQHHLPSKEELKKKYNRINRLTEEPAQARFLKSKNINCIALCEVILSKELQQHGNIWVCPVPDHVCTRFLFVYENGQVGDVHINTQDNEIRNEILQAISTEPF